MSEKQQFAYILQLKKEAHIHEPDSWTDKDKKIVATHFTYLQKLTETGTVLMAGRSLVETTESFGIVVFQAKTADEAQQIMDNDPAVLQGLMTAKLHPFSVALWQK